MAQFRKSLRNKNIDYRKGRYFVTIQVARNKYLLGTIVGTRCVLNELGTNVETALVGLPHNYSELELGPYVIMPNHVHMILDISYRESNEENHLGFLVGRFKGVTTFLYGKLKREGKVPDVGNHLWQFDYWDDLISSEEEFRNFELYIRNNPKNWSRERWGAVTQYVLGEESLLNFPMRAFVASQGFAAAGLAPRCISPSERGTLVPLTPTYFDLYQCAGT